MQKFQKYSFILFFLGYSCLLQSQIPIHWSINKTNGLPTNTIYKMLQDNDGLIWFATSAGLVRYNSLEFTTVPSNTLQDNEFVTLQIDSLNRVWVTNISNQIAYVDSSKLVNLELLNLPLKVANISLYFSNQDLFMVLSRTSTSASLHAYSNMSYLYKIPIDEISNKLNLDDYLVRPYKNTISDIARLKEELFIVKAKGRGKYKLESLSQDSFAYKIPQKIKTYLQNWGKDALIYRPLSDGIHAIYGKNKCVFWNDKGNVIYKEVAETITAIGKLESKFWVLTKKGILFFNLKGQDISPKTIYTNYAFSSFLHDREGNIWLGTLDKGILIIPSENFQSPSYDKAPFFSLFSSPNNLDFWAGSRENLVFFEKENNPTKIQIPAAVGRILSIHQKNSLTVFAADNGVFWNEFPTKDFRHTPKSKATKKVLFDNKGNLWIGRYNSFIGHFNAKEGLNGNELFLLPEKTFAIEEDKQGNIWAGTVTGLYKIEEGKSSLRIGNDSISYFVKDIKMGFDSSLFVATCNHGVLRVNISGTQVDSLVLPYQDCFSTILCEENGVWIGGKKGIIYYNLSDNTTRQISRYDGLPSNEVNALISIENWIWAATAKGLVKFPKNTIEKRRKPAVISIKSIDVNGNKITSDYSSINLKHFQNNLKIEFETINFYLRGTTEFKYRLLPSEKWNTTYQPYAQFTNLKPGNYDFEVSLVNNVPIAKFPKLQFNIDTPWWQKLWLQLLILAIIVGLTLWWAYAKQQRALAKEKKAGAAKIKEEKEKRATQDLISELKMTALQAQMNPHFIFNCLNTIQSFIFKNDAVRATESLGMFSKLIRNVFEYSEEKILSLEKEIDFLHLYLKLEQLRFGQDLEVKVELSDFVTNNLFALSVPPLLIQPIIENAFAHGLMHSSGHKKLSIHFEMKGDYLKCTVCDNGVGREYSAKTNTWEIKNKKSAGLKLTQSRLKTFNSYTQDNNKLDKCFVITDLKDKINGTAIGTKVEMYIKND